MGPCGKAGRPRRTAVEADDKSIARSFSVALGKLGFRGLTRIGREDTGHASWMDMPAPEGSRIRSLPRRRPVQALVSMPLARQSPPRVGEGGRPRQANPGGTRPVHYRKVCPTCRFPFEQPKTGKIPLYSVADARNVRNMGNLTIKTNSRFSLVTIVNYEEYQQSAREVEQPVEQPVNSRRTAGEQPVNTNNNDNNSNKGERHPAPLSSFCAKLSLHITPRPLRSLSTPGSLTWHA